MEMINLNNLNNHVNENYKEMYLTNSFLNKSIKSLSQKELVDTRYIVDLIAQLCLVIEHEQNELTQYNERYGTIK